MNIFFCGDIMPGGVLPYQNHYIDKDVLAYMLQFDLRVGTLECGVGTNIPFDTAKMNNTKSIIYARDEDLARLKEMNINVVTLANNHAFDLGLEGFENVIRHLENMGIKYCGAGHNIEEARKPAVVEMNGRTVAFLGCMINVPIPTVFHKATETEYGVFQESIEVLEEDIAKAKRLYDSVIVMPHWGEEHSYNPPVYCKSCARRMISAGADAIIGSHPHIINPVIRYKGKKCYFSLGNFLFPEKCMQVPRPMYYPETIEEYRSLRRMWTYPRSITEPIVAVWKPKNRIGMYVEMNIDDRICSRYYFVCLTSDNVLRFYSSFVVRMRLAFWSMLLYLPNYSLILRLYKHRLNLLRCLVDKMPAFNIPVKL